MKNDNYIVIQGFMRNELNLKGNELMVYALVYGFSQDDQDEFTGSVSYIAEWIGTSKQTVFNVIRSLIEKDLIQKDESYNNGVKFCKYKTLPVVKKFDKGVVKNFDGGSQKILPNNIDNITTNNTIDYKGLISSYNTICNRLNKCERLTQKRKTHIKARIAQCGIDELMMAFRKANESDFLCGVNNRCWRADFDWLMKNEENITKVLEGKYDNKDQRGETEMELQRAYDAIRGDDHDNGTFNLD